MPNHLQHTHHWESAMRCGLIGGRPFSEPCVITYKTYMEKFLNTYGELTVDNVKDLLLTIPVENFAKRLKNYEAIRCFAKYLIDQEELGELFLTKVAKYKPKRHIPPKKITVSEEEIDKLLTVCDTPLDIILIELLSQTGLRVTEACNLMLEDINLEKGFLTVQIAKWGKTRRVGLTPRAIQAIETYLQQRPDCESDRLLVTVQGDSIVRYGVRTRLDKLGRRVDVRVTLHALRRAFVTINANKGRDCPPVLDGNGRVGRLLITFFLLMMGDLKQPNLYLSLYFKNNRPAYYERLSAVRSAGDWEGWLQFFLTGVAETAEQVVMTSQAIDMLPKMRAS